MKVLCFLMFNNFGVFQTTGHNAFNCISYYTLSALKRFEADFHSWKSDLCLMVLLEKVMWKLDLVVCFTLHQSITNGYWFLILRICLMVLKKVLVMSDYCFCFRFVSTLFKKEDRFFSYLHSLGRPHKWKRTQFNNWTDYSNILSLFKLK